MKNYMAFIIFSSVLVGCGGGSSGDSSNTSTESNSIVNTVDTASDDSVTETELAEEDQVIESTSDLVVDSGFVFATSYSVDVDVDVSQRIDEDTYLLLCANFERQGDGFDVDYSDCIVRVNMAEGKYQSSILLPNHVQTLVSAVWRFEEGVEPEVTLWDRAIHGEMLSLR